MERQTLKDIARALKKSVSTISKVLSDSPDIGHETKTEVLAYIAKKNYRINRTAQGLKTGRSNCIGIIVPFIDNAFFSQVYQGIEKVLRTTDYSIIIMQSKDNKNLELDCLNTLRLVEVDGLIISPIGDNKTLRFLEQLIGEKFPLVIADGIDNSLNANKVGINNVESAFQATQHMIEQGYSKILHLSMNKNGVVFERIRGYIKCLSFHNIPINLNYIKLFPCKDRTIVYENVLKFLNDLNNSDDKIDAIFAGTDFMTDIVAFGQNELIGSDRIPLIGYCNSHFSRAYNPPLSCIYQPGEEIGKLAAEKLLEIMKNNRRGWPNTVEIVKLKSNLVIRKSSIIDRPTFVDR